MPWSASCPAWLPGWAASLTEARKEVSKSGLPLPLVHPGSLTAVLFSAEGDPPSPSLGKAGALGRMLRHPCPIKSSKSQRILHHVSSLGHRTMQPPMCLHHHTSFASHSAPSRQAVLWTEEEREGSGSGQHKSWGWQPGLQKYSRPLSGLKKHPSLHTPKVTVTKSLCTVTTSHLNKRNRTFHLKAWLYLVAICMALLFKHLKIQGIIFSS